MSATCDVALHHRMVPCSTCAGDEDAVQCDHLAAHQAICQDMHPHTYRSLAAPTPAAPWRARASCPSCRGRAAPCGRSPSCTPRRSEPQPRSDLGPVKRILYLEGPAARQCISVAVPAEARESCEVLADHEAAGTLTSTASSSRLRRGRQAPSECWQETSQGSRRGTHMECVARLCCRGLACRDRPPRMSSSPRLRCRAQAHVPGSRRPSLSRALCMRPAATALTCPTSAAILFGNATCPT